MYLKKTKLIALILMLSAAEVAAQSITGSPYTRYGIGDLTFPGTGHNLSMGGTTAAESNMLYINTVNPACNTNLPLQRFVFDVGLDVKYTNTKSVSESEKTCKSTFRYLAGGFSAKPWWFFNFSLKPYSSTGYSASYTDSTNVFEGTKYPYTKNYKGEGGLNKVTIGTAFKFLKMFSIGFNGSVIFGSIEHNQTSTIARDGFVINGTEYPYKSTYYLNDKRVMHGMQGDIGLRFEKRFKSAKDSLRDALRISLGAFFNGKANLKARNEIFIDDQHTYFSYRYNGDTYYTASIDTIQNDTTSNRVKLPKGFGIGASVEIAEQLTINADYHTQQWSGFELPNDASKSKMRDSKYMGIGMQYVNSKYSSKYYRTIIYRIGTYSQQTYFQIDGHGIDDKGVTFGIGFPIKLEQLLLNVNLQFGKRGTTDNGLYEEKYFLIHFNATLHDIWFVKRKFH